MKALKSCRHVMTTLPCSRPWKWPWSPSLLKGSLSSVFPCALGREPLVCHSLAPGFTHWALVFNFSTGNSWVCGSAPFSSGFLSLENQGPTGLCAVSSISVSSRPSSCHIFMHNYLKTLGLFIYCKLVLLSQPRPPPQWLGGLSFSACASSCVTELLGDCTLKNLGSLVCHCEHHLQHFQSLNQALPPSLSSLKYPNLAVESGKLFYFSNWQALPTLYSLRIPCANQIVFPLVHRTLSVSSDR